MTRNGSKDFESTMRDLRLAVVHVNSTRVDLSVAEGLSSWIASAMNHLKEWAGLGVMAVMLVVACLVGLWYICKMRFAQKQHAAMVAQAFVAMDAG